MYDGNRVRGIIDEPKPFSLSDRRFGNLPSFPNPPFLSLPTLLSATSEPALMSTILLLLRGNVHGARLKPYELV
jgi:hypothetical protein